MKWRVQKEKERWERWNEEAWAVIQVQILFEVARAALPARSSCSYQPISYTTNGGGHAIVLQLIQLPQPLVTNHRAVAYMLPVRNCPRSERDITGFFFEI